jgi:hypothetical protein
VRRYGLQAANAKSRDKVKLTMLKVWVRQVFIQNQRHYTKYTWNPIYPSIARLEKCLPTTGNGTVTSLPEA